MADAAGELLDDDLVRTGIGELHLVDAELGVSVLAWRNNDDACGGRHGGASSEL
jgi:hypothetical protein